ncbi:MAG: DUF6151 family protein [Pseudomonadota bacterium]
MNNKLTIRCACGAVRGIAHHVTIKEVNRVVCYCRHCQAYANFLGRAEQVVDAQGGTEMLHLSPRHLDINNGLEHIACVHFTEKGALRWYAKCCNTPIANTLQNVRMPFMAVIHTCIDRTMLDAPIEGMIGPVRARVNKRFPKQDRPREATASALLFMIMRYSALFALWGIRGDGKHSPFLNQESGMLITPPVLTNIDL